MVQLNCFSQARSGSCVTSALPHPLLAGQPHIYRPNLSCASTGNGNGSAVLNGSTFTDVFGNQTVPGPEMNVGKPFSAPVQEPEPPSAEVQAILDEQGIDLEVSQLKYMNNQGRVRYCQLDLAVTESAYDSRQLQSVSIVRPLVSPWKLSVQLALMSFPGAAQCPGKEGYKSGEDEE